MRLREISVIAGGSRLMCVVVGGGSGNFVQRERNDCNFSIGKNIFD